MLSWVFTAVWFLPFFYYIIFNHSADVLRQILVFVCRLPLISLRRSVLFAWRGSCEPCWKRVLGRASLGNSIRERRVPYGADFIVRGPRHHRDQSPRNSSCSNMWTQAWEQLPFTEGYLLQMTSHALLHLILMSTLSCSYNYFPPILQGRKQNTKRLSNILKIMRISLAKIWARIKWLCTLSSYQLLIYRQKGEPRYHVWPAMARKLC